MAEGDGDTALEAPEVSGTTPTNDQTPTWTWTIPTDTDVIRYQLDSEAGAWTEVATTETEYTPGTDLPEGHTLYMFRQVMVPGIGQKAAAKP